MKKNQQLVYLSSNKYFKYLVYTENHASYCKTSKESICCGAGAALFLFTNSCPTLCDPMNCSTPAFPILHHLPKFTPPSPPALNLSQHQGLFQWVSSSHLVAKVLKLHANSMNSMKRGCMGMRNTAQEYSGARLVAQYCTLSNQIFFTSFVTVLFYNLNFMCIK